MTTVPDEVIAAIYLIVAIFLFSGAIAGIRAGKFVLGRRLGFSPYPVFRDRQPILFWLVAATLAGIGILLLLALRFLS